MEKISENEKARGKTKRVKEIFMEWSQRVDINVYTKMLDYRPNYKVQAIWLIILLGSTGATFYFISKSILDYLITKHIFTPEIRKKIISVI